MNRTPHFGMPVLLATLFGVALTALSWAGDADKPLTIAPKAEVAQFPEWVMSVAVSPDGQTIAAGSYEQVRLFSTESREAIATLKVKSGYVNALAFSPDGRLLAAGDFRSVFVWDAKSHKLVQTLKGHRGYIADLAFAPNSKQIATASEDGTARIWNVADGSVEKELTGHSYAVHGVAFSPDGTLIATAAGDETRVTKPGEVKLWDVASGTEKHTLPEHKRVATDVAFSPDGTHLVSTSADETVNVYEVASGKALGFFGKHGRPTNAALFAPDGKTVVSAAGGRAQGKNEVKIWNRANGEEWATLEGHEGPVTSVALSSDGKTLVTGSLDKTVKLWDVSKVLSKAAGASESTSAPIQLVSATEERQEAKNDATEPTGLKTLRAGIIGLDTSHAIAFTKILNDPKAESDVAGCRIVAAYPKGSPDIESSVSRVPGYTKQVQEMGVEIVDSIEALLEKVDVVFLETNDGRPHLEQALPVLKARKPLFIDKPIAASLADAVAIFEAARKYDTPVFTSSSLRFTDGAQALRNGKIGDITGCDAYSPCSLEATHPDLFWYGIHGVETLFTVMGTGCESVTRASTKGTDVVVGVWDGGRIGTFRGIRTGKTGYGGTAFGTKGIEQIGSYGGYRPLLVEIVKFFRTHKPPVSEAETLEIYAFMEAADESKRQGGVPVTLESVMKKAREEAAETAAAGKSF